MDPVSDNALMLKVKEGDTDKMGLLYERYYRELFRFIFKMTMQKELSEDMVQNIFLRMLKYRKGFTGTGEFRTWMYHVARNVLYDDFKSRKRTPTQNSLQLENLKEKLVTYETNDEAGEKQVELKRLEMAIERLSIENRELLVLCRFQDMKYSEIATLLDISEGAVKVRIHRAMNQLKAYYFETDKTKAYGMPVL